MTHRNAIPDRTAELEDLAAQEGLRLPMSALAIVLYEVEGYVVDLCTGEVLYNGAARRMGPGPALLVTFVGEDVA